MAAKGKGKDYYHSTYTHQQLWDMLGEGDDFSVERAGSIWISAASGMKAAREELDTHVISLRTQWTGAASDEFDGRMNLVKQYSVESENGMTTAGEFEIPALATALKNAQTQAEALNPAYIDEYEDWVQSKKNVDPASAEAQTKKTQWQQEYETELDQSHANLAQIIADLGDQYAIAKEQTFGEPPPPPPSGMPGNTSYQPPTGGVFSETSLDSSNSIDNTPGSTDTTTTTGNDDGLNSGDPDDLDPVDGSWDYGSYDDVDSNLDGGLASGGIPAGGGGFTSAGGGSLGGGTSLAGAGAGLFGPAQGTSGAGSASGRGSGSSPARAGASNSKPGSSNARSGGARSGGARSGSGNSKGLSSSSRNAIKGGGNNNSRGGSRSGYSDDEEEEYTRETWLREDDVDWGQNNVRREELDDED